MKIVVVGGSGLIGSRVVETLAKNGHDVLPASPSTGVSTTTGERLNLALAGADVVIDVTNSPSFEGKAAMDFFTTSGRNLLSAEISAGIRHHIALSVVGAERIAGIGYFRAKRAQEVLIEESSIPYSIVHSTQFFESFESIARSADNDGDVIFIPKAYFQPIASDDVAAAVAQIALDKPGYGTVEIAGPEELRMPEIIQRYLIAQSDPRRVSSDIHAKYFGGEIDEESALMPNDNAILGSTTFESWLNKIELVQSSTSGSRNGN